jgi:tRNA(adenine34) deaminase
MIGPYEDKLVSPNDEFFMQEALSLAQTAYKAGEVPIGAIVVREGNIIGRGYNQTELKNDQTQHAELLALQEAARTLGAWRLTDCDLYVTVEPCTMCAGACVNARLRAIVAGCLSPKYGSCISNRNVIARLGEQNHEVLFRYGVLAQESSALLQQFFKTRR